MVKSRPATSLLHRPSAPSPGPDPCDVAASRGRHVRPQGPWASDFQNLPAASWPRMPVPIQRPSARHVSGTSHVGVRCGAPAPEETDTAQTSRLSASRSEKQVAAAAHSAATNTSALLACSAVSAARPPAIEISGGFGEARAPGRDERPRQRRRSGRGGGDGGGRRPRLRAGGGRGEQGAGRADVGVPARRVAAALAAARAGPREAAPGGGGGRR